MATDSAANSDSTLMNSQPWRSPDLTISPKPSTICVCGVMGYAQMTCGRQSAMASATAREPSICLSMHGLQAAGHHRVRLHRSDNVLFRDRGRKFFTDGCNHRLELEHAADGGKGAEQRHIRNRSADVLQRELGGGHRREAITPEAAGIAA